MRTVALGIWMIYTALRWSLFFNTCGHPSSHSSQVCYRIWQLSALEQCEVARTQHISISAFLTEWTPQTWQWPLGHLAFAHPQVAASFLIPVEEMKFKRWIHFSTFSRLTNGRAGTPGHPVGIHWALPKRSQKKHPGLEVLGELVIHGQDLKRMVVVDPKFICWNPNPNVMVCSGWDLWKAVRSGGWNPCEWG